MNLRSKLNHVFVFACTLAVIACGGKRANETREGQRLVRNAQAEQEGGWNGGGGGNESSGTPITRENVQLLNQFIGNTTSSQLKDLAKSVIRSLAFNYTAYASYTGRRQTESNSLPEHNPQDFNPDLPEFLSAQRETLHLLLFNEPAPSAPAAKTRDAPPVQSRNSFQRAVEIIAVIERSNIDLKTNEACRFHEAESTASARPGNPPTICISILRLLRPEAHLTTSNFVQVLTALFIHEAAHLVPVGNQISEQAIQTLQTALLPFLPSPRTITHEFERTDEKLLFLQQKLIGLRSPYVSPSGRQLIVPQSPNTLSPDRNLTTDFGFVCRTLTELYVHFEDMTALSLEQSVQGILPVNSQINHLERAWWQTINLLDACNWALVPQEKPENLLRVTSSYPKRKIMLNLMFTEQAANRRTTSDGIGQLPRMSALYGLYLGLFYSGDRDPRQQTIPQFLESVMQGEAGGQTINEEKFYQALERLTSDMDRLLDPQNRLRIFDYRWRATNSTTINKGRR